MQERYTILFPAQRECYERRERKIINNLLDFIILGKLLMGEAHGYQIMEDIRKEFGYNPGTSRIYPELKNQEREGHITTKSVEVNGRLRKVHSLTPKGRIYFENSLKRLDNIVKKLKTKIRISKWKRRV